MRGYRVTQDQCRWTVPGLSLDPSLTILGLSPNSSSAFELDDIEAANLSQSGGRFLDASSHLYKKVCPSVRPLVRRSVGNQLFSNSENEVLS